MYIQSYIYIQVRPNHGFMRQLETYAHQLDSKSSFSANANNRGVFVPGICMCMHACKFPPNNTGFSVHIQIIEERVFHFLQMPILKKFLCQVYVFFDFFSRTKEFLCK